MSLQPARGRYRCPESYGDLSWRYADHIHCWLLTRKPFWKSRSFIIGPKQNNDTFCAMSMGRVLKGRTIADPANPNEFILVEGE